jgi:hypothetical protein
MDWFRCPHNRALSLASNRQAPAPQHTDRQVFHTCVHDVGCIAASAHNHSSVYWGTDLPAHSLKDKPPTKQPAHALAASDSHGKCNCHQGAFMSSPRIKST